MPLDDRRLALLREMGVPFWQPAAARQASPQTPEPAPAAAQSPSSRASRPVSAHLPAVAPAPGPMSAAAAAAVPVADVSTLDWPALQQAVADCRACGLCATRRQTVFGVGHPRAHWMVVGEAPGEQEDLRGEPFVGPAGRLLDRMLSALGLTRAEAHPEGATDPAPGLGPDLGLGAEVNARQVYIANTLKCRPPGNRNPDPAELARCEPYLVRQIELVQPRVILAMGRFAVQALLRTDEPIGRLRGRVHRYQGVPLIVTYHPAYLLRNPLDKAKAWDDLCLAMDTMQGPGPGPREPA